MKMYILDENGRVVFEFDKDKYYSDERELRVSTDEGKIKITELLRAAFIFLSYSIGRK